MTEDCKVRIKGREVYLPRQIGLRLVRGGIAWHAASPKVLYLRWKRVLDLEVYIAQRDG